MVRPLEGWGGRLLGLGFLLRLRFVLLSLAPNGPLIIYILPGYLAIAMPTKKETKNWDPEFRSPGFYETALIINE